jgi:phage shock protein C
MKRLTRTDGYIGGVCGGLGEYFNIDPILPRLFFVLTLTTGSFWIYLILWMFTKQKEDENDVI